MCDGLRVRGLHVSYGPVRAVSALDLDVARGEIVAVLGRSGSGKSSLLRAVAGLVKPSAGTVSWDGADVTRRRTPKRDFGLLASAPSLFPKYDVAGNVAYGLGSWARGDRERRVAELLGRLGLAEFADARVDALTDEQGRRVALARSVAPRPRLLLLDEPLGGMGGRERANLGSELVALLRAEGVPALYVTHAVDEAFAVADRVLFLQDGCVVQSGTPRDLREHPASRTVAEHLGFAPFLAGSADGETVTTALGTVPGPGLTGPVLVGLGPEGLRLAAAGQPLRVRSESARPGFVEVAVRLPDGQTGYLRVPAKQGRPEVGVMLDAAGCVVVPAE
ncbi:ABC transporter ATP-binding protein [Propionicicella superfundia]|uniref:ABC transporter ATP-binding protein n=1 Tax=Propionicicella superfundia TaxID=348582 RepID=UPI0004197859|nr:ABC transporter ATP-binding protein [Propionicicella superfundia]